MPATIFDYLDELQFNVHSYHVSQFTPISLVQTLSGYAVVLLYQTPGTTLGLVLSPFSPCAMAGAWLETDLCSPSSSPKNILLRHSSEKSARGWLIVKHSEFYDHGFT